MDRLAPDFQHSSLGVPTFLLGRAALSSGGSRCYRSGMGRKGGKPSKPEHSQHLPKVGSADENERLLHEEREAVLGQFGARGTVAKTIVTVVVVVAVVASILTLLLIVFR
jgi:hypothetical protein